MESSETAGGYDPNALQDNRMLARLLCEGIRLVEQGREAELDDLFRRMRSIQSEDDRATDFEVQAAVDEIKGYSAWKGGNLEAAAAQWEDSNDSGVWGAIWRGDLYRDLGKLQTAEGWYVAAWKHPVAHERLGYLYEEMGKPEEAVAAFRRFIEAWKNADASLQKRVQAARERVRAAM